MNSFPILLLLVLILRPTQATLSLTPHSTTVGQYQTFTFNLDQKCGNASSGWTALKVILPPNCLDVQIPTLPGWHINKEASPETDATGVARMVTVVTYTGTLFAGYFQQLPVRAFLHGAIGEIVYFKAFQDCPGGGTDFRWADIPAPGVVEPAFAVTLVDNMPSPPVNTTTSREVAEMPVAL